MKARGSSFHYFHYKKIFFLSFVTCLNGSLSNRIGGFSPSTLYSIEPIEYSINKSKMTMESGGFVMINNVAVKVSNVSKEFLLGQDKTVSILKDVSLSVNYGEFVSILGVSGSGKSTLLSCLSSLSEPTKWRSCYQWCKSLHLKRREAC